MVFCIYSTCVLHKKRVLFLKNKNNNGSIKNLCTDYYEVIFKVTHPIFLSEDPINLTNEINKFLSK